MGKRRRIPRWRTGTDIGKVIASIQKAVEGKPAKDVWEEFYTKEGLPVFQAWLEEHLPFVHLLGSHWDLTEEQRQVAVKEYWRRQRMLMKIINARVAEVAFLFAKRTIATRIREEVKPLPVAPLVV